MTTYGSSTGSPAVPPPVSPMVPTASAAPAQRAAMMHLAAGALGVLSFIWGFLTWFTEGNGGGAFHFAGYAFSSAGVAPIGLSILAGAIAVAYTVDGKVTSFVPSAVAIAALLTVIGVAGGKGNVGPGNAQIGMGVGLILELITCAVQVAVLLIAWLAANGRIGVARPPAHPGYPTPRTGYPAPGSPASGYPAPSYPPQGHPYPGQTSGGYGPPSYVQPGYHRPQTSQTPAPPSNQPPNQQPSPPTEPRQPSESGYGEPQQ